MTENCKNDPILNAQKQHWDRTYAEKPEFFGEEPSYPAKKAAKIFKAEGKCEILELGSGHGRDALYFASLGFKVTALDYSETAVNVIKEKANKLALSENVNAVGHDVRKRLPFASASFDACYCHMLYCMALCNSELEALFREVGRVLRPNGLSVYTVRHTKDPHYGKGIPRGEDMFEIGGLIVHFFSKEKIIDLEKGFEITDIEEFEEGELPRKLFLVGMKKKRLTEATQSLTKIENP